MATYYADVTLGNDANSGTAPGAGNAKATASAAIALATAAGDVVEFEAGTYPLTANILINNSNGVTLRSKAGLAPSAVEFTGAFQFTTTGAAEIRLINLTFKNYTSTIAAVTPSNSGVILAFESCILDGAASATARAIGGFQGVLTFTNCIIKNFDYVNNNIKIGVVWENCKFQNIAVVSTVNLHNEFIGCEFTKVKWVLDLGTTSLNPHTDMTSFRYCTFDLQDAFGIGSHGSIYRYGSVSVSVTAQSYRFNHNIIYNTNKIVLNTSGGILTVASSPLIKNNWIQSGTDVTNYTSSGGDVTGNSNPEFYDASTQDYRLEPTSTAAVGNNGQASTMGANELETPTTFFSDPGIANVVSPTAYKFNQRIGNNRTGTATPGYPLLPAGDVRLGVDRGNGTFGTYDPITGIWEAVSAADLRLGVSKKQNGITVVGLINLPALGEVKAGITFDNGTKTGTRTDANPSNVKTGTGTYGADGTELTPSYTPDFPAVSNVLPEDTVDGVQGTANVDTLANLPTNTNVKTGTPNYGKNLNIIPAYSPDFPARASVLASDTVDNLAGLLALAEVLVSSGGTYQAPNPAYYKLNETYGPNGSIVGTYTASGMPPEEWVLDGKEYGNGSFTGSLGRIVSSNMDITPQIRDNMNAFLTNFMTGWTEMGYLLDEDLNNFKGNLKRFGVIPGQMRALGLLYGQESIEREFEIKLINRYINKGNSDKLKRAAGDEILTKLEEIRRRGTASNYGNYNSVMNVGLAEEPELEYLNADEIVVGKLTIRVIFSVDRLN